MSTTRMRRSGQVEAIGRFTVRLTAGGIVVEPGDRFAVGHELVARKPWAFRAVGSERWVVCTRGFRAGGWVVQKGEKVRESELRHQLGGDERFQPCATPSLDEVRDFYGVPAPRPYCDVCRRHVDVFPREHYELELPPALHYLCIDCAARLGRR